MLSPQNAVNIPCLSCLYAYYLSYNLAALPFHFYKTKNLICMSRFLSKGFPDQKQYSTSISVANFQNCPHLVKTVKKIHNFPTLQILREIDCGTDRNLKTGLLAFFDGSEILINFGCYFALKFTKMEIQIFQSQKTEKMPLLNFQKRQN